MVVVDKLENSHIYKHCGYFIEKSRPVTTRAVATIGGIYLKPSDIGTVKWLWKDDYGKTHDVLLDKTLYIPESTVILISSTVFVKKINTFQGTWIKSCLTHSIFTWDKEQFIQCV